MLAHLCRHQAKEITDANRGLEHTAAAKAQPAHRLPDRRDDCGRCVVRVLCGIGCGLIFLRAEQIAQFLAGSLPALGKTAILAREGGFKTAPSDILGKNRLVGAIGRSTFLCKLLEEANGGEVLLNLLALAALSDLVLIADDEIARDLRRRSGCRFWWLLVFPYLAFDPLGCGIGISLAPLFIAACSRSVAVAGALGFHIGLSRLVIAYRLPGSGGNR